MKKWSAISAAGGFLKFLRIYWPYVVLSKDGMKELEAALVEARLEGIQDALRVCPDGPASEILSEFREVETKRLRRKKS